MNSDNSTRPSFFEAYATEQLSKSLRPAFRYVLEVLSIRNPRLLRLSVWADEIFCALLIILESSQLKRDAALLSESFYSLRRSTKLSFQSEFMDKPLSRNHIMTSIIFSVLIPHVRAKLDDWYRARTGGAAAAILGELRGSESVQMQRGSRLATRAVSRRARTGYEQRTRITRFAAALLSRLSFSPRAIVRFVRFALDYVKSEQFQQRFAAYYPKLVAMADGLNMVFNILYLYGNCKYYSVSLAMQGLILRRVSTTDLLQLRSVFDGSSRDDTGGVSVFLSSMSRKLLGVLRVAFFGCIFSFRFIQYYYAAEVSSTRS